MWQYIRASGNSSIVNKTYYHCIVFLFGLSAAPRVFTKCMAMVTAFMRKLGVHVFPYLDDWLVRSQSKAKVLSNMMVIQSTIEAQGLLIKREKSILSPVQRIEFIGVVLDYTDTRSLLLQLRF